jgi:hypothetical protein
MLLIAVIAVATWTVNKAKQQGIAVAALGKMGCSVGYDVSNGGSPTLLGWLRKLLGEEVAWNATSVSCGGKSSHVTDEGLVQLQGLTQLYSLDLADTQVTDAGLVHLRGLTQLHSLYLDGTRVTDAGLVHLRGLTRLRILYLVGTQTTDVGVQELQKALPDCQINP